MPTLKTLARLLLLGCVLLCALLAPALTGCAASLSSAQVECQLGVLRGLPEDPMQATAADAVVAIHRLKACDALPTDAVPTEAPPDALPAPTTGPGPPRDAGR